jgi:glycosyltransferase involved in cell wall biosynthesis
VLVIDSYTPTPDRDSGSLRMAELLGLLVEEGCSVVFMAQSLTHDGAYSEALQQRGVEVWWQPWVGYLPRWLARECPQLDAVIVSRHYVLEPLLPLLREFAPQAQIVFDTVDLHFLREHREAEHGGNADAVDAAAHTRRTELALLDRVDLTWVVSETERQMLAQLAPAARVGVVSNIHRLFDHTPGPTERRDLVFVGGFRHPPNVDAALWLGQDIFPRIRAALPDVRLRVVGGDAPAEVLALSQVPGVEVLGHVPDLDPLLDASRISLAPLRYGAGIKGKVNQSLARGLPVVATSCAVEGMFLQDGRDVLVADGAKAFAAAVVRLYGDEMLWSRLREAGFENTRQHFSRQTARKALQDWLAALAPNTP